MYDFLLELKKVSIWGALPLFVNVIFVIIIITVSSMKKTNFHLSMSYVIKEKIINYKRFFCVLIFFRKCIYLYARFLRVFHL